MEESFEWGWRGPCFELMKQNQAIIAYVYFSDDRKIAVPLYCNSTPPQLTRPPPFCFLYKTNTVRTMKKQKIMQQNITYTYIQEVHHRENIYGGPGGPISLLN
jgi:hypothetical protein